MASTKAALKFCGNQNWSGGCRRAHYSIRTPCDLGAGSDDAYDTGYDTGICDDTPLLRTTRRAMAPVDGGGCVPPPPVDPCGCDPYPVNYPPRRHQTWVQPIEIKIDFELAWIWRSSTGQPLRS